MKAFIQTFLALFLSFVWIFSSNCEKSRSCRNFRRRHILKMACSDGGKIFLPRLVGFSNKNCGGCQGQSSELLAQEHDCSWKAKCKVKLNKMHMITGCYEKINSVLIGERRCIQRGIIQDRVGWQKKTYQFSCPKNSVIHSIDLHMSYVPYAKRSKPLCQGLSPQLLVQKNNCFWKERCEVSWNSPQVLAMSNDSNCIGKQGSLFTTKEHQCMQKKRIHDICKKSEAKGKRGLLRSHDDYPWNYRARLPKCTTLIKIKPEGALYLRLHDIDLDTQRDHLSVLHVRTGRSSCSVELSSLQEGVWLYGGYVKIQFVVHPRTRSGRGFIMSYKNVKERIPRDQENKPQICS